MSHPITVLSFGYLHPWPEGVEKPSEEDTYDLRELLADPAHVPSGAMLDMTGMDPDVVRFVFNTPGADALVARICAKAITHVAERPVVLALGCAGGRHRSVAVANRVDAALRWTGYEVSVDHLHVHLPRVIKDEKL